MTTVHQIKFFFTYGYILSLAGSGWEECGPFWLHENGYARPWSGLHSSRSTAAWHTAWGEHTLKITRETPAQYLTVMTTDIFSYRATYKDNYCKYACNLFQIFITRQPQRSHQYKTQFFVQTSKNLTHCLWQVM